MAIATAEAGSINPSIVLWDSLRRTTDSTQAGLSNSMMNVLTASPNMLSKMGDADKYAYCRYRIQLSDTAEFTRTINAIQNEDYKAKAILDFSRKLYAQDEIQSAIKIFTKLKNLKFSDPRTNEDIHHFQLLMLAQLGDFNTLSEQIDKTNFEGSRKNEKLYYATLIALASGDTATVTKNFNHLSDINFFFDDAIVASSAYFKTHSREKLKAYTILVNALQRHPNSVKITKAYCLESAELGFDEFTQTALEQLKEMLPEKTYNQFIAKNSAVLNAPSN